jgi:hypothetical protein
MAGWWCGSRFKPEFKPQYCKKKKKKKKKKKPTQNKKQKNLREVIATVSVIFLKYPRQDTNEEKGVMKKGLFTSSFVCSKSKIRWLHLFDL